MMFGSGFLSKYKGLLGFFRLKERVMSLHGPLRHVAPITQQLDRLA